MSNSQDLNGGASLFLTTRTRVRLPRISPAPVLTAPMRRTSSRTDAKNLRALPPVVVSGEPKVTPILWRSWLMRMSAVPLLRVAGASLRIACPMSRACSPTFCSPISPSISALGVKAATESITTRSTSPLRAKSSASSRPCSPESGCVNSSRDGSTPRALAYSRSRACSASMKAAMPPRFCTSTIAWRVSVVFPDDSGP